MQIRLEYSIVQLDFKHDIDLSRQGNILGNSMNNISRALL